MFFLLLSTYCSKVDDDIRRSVVVVRSSKRRLIASFEVAESRLL